MTVTPPFQRIADDLRNAITSGALPAGSRLPSGRVLAALYNVARNTAVHAVRALETEGIVESRHGSGVFVAGPGPVDPIVNQLREARLSAGLLQQDLARMTGISQASISRMEAGVTQPHLHTIRQIAEALSFSIALVDL